MYGHGCPWLKPSCLPCSFSTPYCVLHLHPLTLWIRAFPCSIADISADGITLIWFLSSSLKRQSVSAHKGGEKQGTSDRLLVMALLSIGQAWFFPQIPLSKSAVSVRLCQSGFGCVCVCTHCVCVCMYVFVECLLSVCLCVLMCVSVADQEVRTSNPWQSDCVTPLTGGRGRGSDSQLGEAIILPSEPKCFLSISGWLLVFLPLVYLAIYGCGQSQSDWLSYPTTRSIGGQGYKGKSKRENKFK